MARVRSQLVCQQRTASLLRPSLDRVPERSAAALTRATNDIPRMREAAGCRELHVVKVSDGHLILVILFDTAQAVEEITERVGSPWMRDHVVPLLAAPTQRSVGEVVVSSSFLLLSVPIGTPIVPNGLKDPIPPAGPYYLSGNLGGVVAVLRRNPNYRGTRPHHLDAVVYREEPRMGDAVTDIEAGKRIMRPNGSGSRAADLARAPLRTTSRRPVPTLFPDTATRDRRTRFRHPARSFQRAIVRQASAERYGRDPALVDQALAERHGHATGSQRQQIPGETPIGRHRRNR